MMSADRQLNPIKGERCRCGSVIAQLHRVAHDAYTARSTIGDAGGVKAVTTSERCSRTIGVQSSNREWATWMAVVNAKGWAVPPFFVFKAKNHDST